MEIWKDIKNYEGIYQISNLNKVKSLSRILLDITGRKQAIKERIMVQSINNSGYKYVPLSKNNSVINHHIHRLMAETFIANTENKPQINHIDSNKLNNNLTNLEWCTQSENIIHAFNNGKIIPWLKGKKGKEVPFSKPLVQLDLNDNLICEYDSIASANRITNIDKGDISKVCNNKRKLAGGYKWKFI